MSFFSSPPINLARRSQGALAVRVGADVPVVVECPASGIGVGSVLLGAAVIGAAAYYFGKSSSKMNSFLRDDRERLLDEKWAREESAEELRTDLQLARVLDRIPTVVISESKKAEMMRDAYDPPQEDQWKALARLPPVPWQRDDREAGGWWPVYVGHDREIERDRRQAKEDAFFAGEGPSPGPNEWPDSPYEEE